MDSLAEFKEILEQFMGEVLSAAKNSEYTSTHRSQCRHEHERLLSLFVDLDTRPYR